MKQLKCNFHLSGVKSKLGPLGQDLYFLPIDFESLDKEEGSEKQKNEKQKERKT